MKKKGLLLKEKPEPIHAIECRKYTCDFIAHTVWEYKVHWKEDHGKEVPHFNVSHRPKQRIAWTKQEQINRNNKLCHCGKKPVKPRRKYCSEACTKDWYNKKIFVNEHRDDFLSRHNGVCEHCGTKARMKHDLEMDHIIAIILGGHPWDIENLQGLCYDCHKVKTKSDVQILAYWKRECKYDIGFNTVISEEYFEIIDGI